MMGGTFPDSWEEVCLVTIKPRGGTSRQFNTITETIDLAIPDYPGESIPNAAGGRIWKQSPQEDGEITLELYPVQASSDEDNAGTFDFFGGLDQKATISAIDGDASTITITTSAAHYLSAGDYIKITGTANYNGYYACGAGTENSTIVISDDQHNKDSETTGSVWSYDTQEPRTTNVGTNSLKAGVDRTRDRFMIAIMWTDDVAVTSADSATSTTDSVALRFWAKECRLVSSKAEFTDGILKVTATFKFPVMSKVGTAMNCAWESTNDGDTSPLPALTYVGY